MLEDKLAPAESSPKPGDYKFQDLYREFSISPDKKKDTVSKILQSHSSSETSILVRLCKKLIDEGLVEGDKQFPENMDQFIDSRLLVFTLFNELKRYADPKKVLGEKTYQSVFNAWSSFDWNMDHQIEHYPVSFGLPSGGGIPYPDDAFYFAWYIDGKDFR